MNFKLGAPTQGSCPFALIESHYCDTLDMVNVDQSILKRGYSANYQLTENMVTVILTSFIEAIIRHLKITGAWNLASPGMDGSVLVSL